jgi:hypothetical protein
MSVSALTIGRCHLSRMGGYENRVRLGGRSRITCTHCMVQYTPDGARSAFASFDRLYKRFA